MNDSQVAMCHHETSHIRDFSCEKQVLLRSSGYDANYITALSLLNELNHNSFRLTLKP